MSDSTGLNGFVSKSTEVFSSHLNEEEIGQPSHKLEQDESEPCQGDEIPVEMWEGRDQQLFKTCVKYSVEFIWPREGETPEQTKARREELQRKCKAARQRQKRNEMSPELRDTLRARQAERMRIKRSQMTPEERRLLRAQQAERMRRRRQSLSPLELETVRARRAAVVRETRRKRRLEKLQAQGAININQTIQSAIAERCNLNDLNILYQTRNQNGTDLQVINVVMPDSICNHCGKQVIEQNHDTIASKNFVNHRSIKIYNFGLAPPEVAKSFHDFCSAYGSLSEALLDLLERERLLVKKYRFLPDAATQNILAMPTNEDYPDVLQTTIEALKKFTKNCKYVSVANALEELLLSPCVLCCDEETLTDDHSSNDTEQNNVSQTSAQAEGKSCTLRKKS